MRPARCFTTIVGAILALGSPWVRAEPGVWTSGGPEGGPVLDLAFDPVASTTLYAASRHAGVWKSVDGGTTWSATGAGLPPSVLDLAVAADGTLYAVGGAGDNGVFKSGDAGVSWTEVLDVPATTVATDPTAVGSLYVGTSVPEVFRSVDSGVSWLSSGVDEGLGESPVSQLVVDPLTSSILYAGTTADKVRKSVDSGATWTMKGAGLPDTVTSLVISTLSPQNLYAATSEGLFKTSNAAETWGTTAGSPDVFTTVLAIDPSFPTTLLAGGFGRVYRTMDGGVSWTELGAVPPQWVSVLAIDPASPGVLYSGSGSGVVKSSDTGATWVEMNTGIRSVRVERLAIDSTTPGTVYAASSESGIFKSTDGGETWSGSQLGLADRRLTDLALAPSDPLVLYASSLTAVVRSDDGASSWIDPVLDPTDFGSLGPTVVSLAIDPVTPSTVLSVNGGFATDPGVLLSVDSGATWSQTYAVAGLSKPVTPGDIAFDPTDPSRAFFSFSSAVAPSPARLLLFRSLDGGATWTEVFSHENAGFAPLSIDPLSPTTIYAVAAPGPDFSVLRSLDGGDLWSPLAVTSPCVLDLLPDPGTPGKIWVACDPVYVSEDAGVTWTAFDDTGLPDGGALQLGLDQGPPTVLYVGTDTGVFSYLVDVPAAIFSDGFESGDMSRWSTTVP